MDFQLKSLRLEQAAAAKTPALVVLVSDEVPAGGDALSRLIRKAIASGDFKAEAGKLLSTYGADGVAAERVLLAGVGDGRPAKVRKAAAAAIAQIKNGPASTVVVVFAFAGAAEAVGAAVLGVAEAEYVYSATKGKEARQKITRLKQAAIAAPDIQDVSAAFKSAAGIAQGIETAREWANRPANHATPRMLADAAKALAKVPGFDCQALGPREVAKLGMGAFAAVAQGSEQELRFIQLRYNGGAKGAAPVVLVGKGITFDTGGISLKPAGEMDEMKFDMGGAASVLGVFQALTVLKPKVNVVGLIPACENMPDGRAVKPGDVVTSMSGQTIEILNTDAEGRLVLCDALTYAERFKPRAVIDIATLTGACVIALGGVRSGLFSSDESLADQLVAAGEQAQDLCWRMPLDDEYADGLKTNFADVANVAGRQAGAVTAAKFLQRFTKAYPWAHLDIAGTAWKSGAAKGATGRPVALLVHYLLALAGQAAPVASAPKRKAAASGKRPGRAAKSA